MEPYHCLCLDVDGVLTDGRIYVADDGRPTRAFHTQDGFAIRCWQDLGGEVVIITGKQSNGVAHRAAELGIRHVVQNSRDKLADLQALLKKLELAPAQVAAIGDDLPDIPVLQACGCGIAVANAVPETRAAASFVTTAPGGRGAVREAIEHLLRRNGAWERVLARYGAGARPT